MMTPNHAAPPNRRPHFTFVALLPFNSRLCAPPLLSPADRIRRFFINPSYSVIASLRMMVADIDADCAQINDLIGGQSREREGVCIDARSNGNAGGRAGFGYHQITGS